MGLLEFNREQIKTLSSLGVQAIYLFGSRAQGSHGPLSDFDFGILTEKSGHRRGDELYFKLLNLLGEICPRNLDNDIIDIVFLRDVGLELRLHVIRYGKVIFDKKPLSRLNFEDQTTLRYCDFRPHLDRFDQSILESL